MMEWPRRICVQTIWSFAFSILVCRVIQFNECRPIASLNL